MNARSALTLTSKKSGSSVWCAHLDLNQGPVAYKTTALTAELWAHMFCLYTYSLTFLNIVVF